MKKETDEVIIKRKKVAKKADSAAQENRGSATGEPVVNPESAEVAAETPIMPKPAAPFLIKLFAVLLVLFGLLLLLSIVSYTSLDADNIQISLVDYVKLFFSNTEFEAKALTTRNWLGITGAIISDYMINATIGYAIALLPVFISAWGLSILRKNAITDSLIKKTIFYVSSALLFSALMGTMQDMPSFLSIPHEMCGNIGLFIGSITIKMLGHFGSAFLFGASMFILILAALDFNFRKAPAKIIKQAVKSKETAVDYINTIKAKKAAEAEEAIKRVNEAEEEVRQASQHTGPAAQKAAPATAPPAPKPEIKADESASASAPIEPKIIIPENKKPDALQPDATYSDPLEIIRTKKAAVQNPDDKYAPPIMSTPPVPPQKQVDTNIIIQKISGLADPEEASNIVRSGGREIEPDVAFSGLNKKSAPSEITTVPPAEPSPAPDAVDKEALSQKTENSGTESSLKTTIETPAHVSPADEISGSGPDAAEVDAGCAPEEPAKPETPEEISTTAPEIIAALPAENASVLTAAMDKPIAAPAPVAIKKPLVVTVLESEEEPPVFHAKEMLSTAIHDEKIDYIPPSTAFLIKDNTQAEVNEEELRMNAKILQEKLETFKIFIEDLSVTPGPVVTQYEFVPAAGIKISKIESLADDLAMALKARGIRIIAPIPGKGTVGVEIPNAKPSLVRFSDVTASPKFRQSQAILPMGLGKTISGEVYVEDLAKMPHLLIAGSTGSGKSVGINTILSSLLFSKHPSELKFVIIDPKKVELQQYSHLKDHFMASCPDVDDIIVTNPADAVTILKSCVLEMEQRYDILAKVGQRNIHDYNRKVNEGKYKDDPDMIHRPMPYIVVIIDELADLMLTASKEIEEPITRLAQMARAIGIHLVVATQRPSVDVITGLIKANFPARIAYLVASKIDSRTILDQQGAEQLLGYGDMLCLPPGKPKPIRVQNAFITTDEVDNICESIGKQKGYSEPYMLPSVNQDREDDVEYDFSDRDPLFEEAAKLIIRHQQGSVSLVQRRLKVGYARAGRIVDELEKAGVVGPPDGSKARIVLMDSESELERIL